MNVSGAEAVVAAASPFVGQGESACLVRPYVDLMTESELREWPYNIDLPWLALIYWLLDVTMTSGFSTIAGSVLVAYMNLGVPPETLVTSSVMSIPASLAISKIRIPETEEPITRGSVTVDRGYEDANKAPVCIFKNIPGRATHSYPRQTLSMLTVREPFLV